MNKILKSYLHKLTNLSSNNKSLLLLRTSEQFLDVHDLDFEAREPSFRIIEGMLAGKQKLLLGDVLESRDKSTNDVSRKLKNLYRADKFIEEERGARDLYIGWPFVKGKFQDDTVVRCPLLFFPAELHNENNQWRLSLRKDAGISFNKSFLLAYAHYNKTQVAEELLEKTFDEPSRDSLSFRTELYEILKQYNLQVNFNQELFIDQLKPFENYKKPDLGEGLFGGELKLYPQAVLGIFPQAGSYIVPDYNFLIENESVKDLEAFFLERNALVETREMGLQSLGLNFLNRVKEELTIAPFKLDASQENALKAAKQGLSAIVQGPPGSGKSQLICNLIADYIARGKKVMVVCQKKAALDVVHQRLKDIGAEQFAALVHDFKNDRNQVFAQVNRQVERIDEYRQRNNGLDTIYMERAYQQACRKIDQVSEELEDFRRALFDTTESGVSVKELYLTSDKDAPAISLRQEYRDMPLAAINDFLKTLNNYFTYATIFARDDYEWKDRVGFQHFSVSDSRRISEILGIIPQADLKVAETLEGLTGTPIGLKKCLDLYRHEDTIRQLIDLLAEPDVFSAFRDVQQETRDEQKWLADMEKALLQSFDNFGMETSLAREELGKFQLALEHYIQAKGTVIKWFKWYFFSKDKFYLKRVLVANGLTWNKQGFNLLTEKLDNRLNFEHNLSMLSEKAWFRSVPTGFNKISFQQKFYHYKQAFKALKSYTRFTQLRNAAKLEQAGYADFKRILLEILDIGSGLSLQYASWTHYLTPGMIGRILDQPALAIQLKNILKQDFDSICECDKLYASFSSAQLAVVEKLDAFRNTHNPSGLTDVFYNSLKLAWIEHIETKYPQLRAVSTLKMKQMEQELQDCIAEKEKLSREILQLKIRERTYRNVELNRLSNMVTYRDLKHQVSKKRQLWPLRKLLSQYPEEVFDLVPCWLASPESVSAMFPMETYFDLVIFDEASQCFAEYAIPAIYRARQVMITGDDKQLRPHDLYKARWEEEEGEPDTEVESLLALGNRYLMQMQLTGHYRSRSLELIDFSNQRFYNGNLSLVPDYHRVLQGAPAIAFIKTEGRWVNNINEAEAEEIVSLVGTLLAEDPQASLGIVTFNFKQQQHIQNLLEVFFGEKKMAFPESLFVKNIENVQGDERDIIIFSIGYAPDEKGKMSMNFGSLNVAGGENRLNVAVTRAREKIYVVSSIMPAQLKVEDAKHEGPRLLKEYLEYAYGVHEKTYKPSLKSNGTLGNAHFLKNRLKAQVPFAANGFSAEEIMPFGDITIKKDGREYALLLTDDNLYHQALSAKDPHGYAPIHLAKKRWPGFRVFSREYWNNREKLQNEILSFLIREEGNR